MSEINPELQAIVDELKAIRADPVRSAEFDRKMEKSMKWLAKKWERDREKQLEDDRRALEHWLKIKDIPFMGAKP